MVLKLTSSETKLTQAQAEKLSLAEERIADNENPVSSSKKELVESVQQVFPMISVESLIQTNSAVK